MSRDDIGHFDFCPVVMLSGCGTAPTASDALGQEQASQQSELAAKDLFGELEGAWFGEVPNVYRACFVFGKLSPATPWSAQAISYWVVRRGRPDVFSFVKKRVVGERTRNPGSRPGDNSRTLHAGTPL